MSIKVSSVVITYSLYTCTTIGHVSLVQLRARTASACNDAHDVLSRYSPLICKCTHGLADQTERSRRTRSVSSAVKTFILGSQLAANKADQKEQASQYDKAFQFYIQAARLYLEVLKIAPAQEAQKAQVKASSAKVLQRAERLKTLRKDLRYTEADILSLG